MRLYWDILASEVLTAVWFVSLLAFPPNPGGSLLGLLVALVILGYLALLVAFPRRGDLAGLARAILCLAVSIQGIIALGVLPALGLVPFNQRASAVMVAATNLLLGTGAFLRRSALPRNGAFVPRPSDMLYLVPKGGLNKSLALGVVGLLITAGAVMYHTFQNPPPEMFTQLYLLDKHGGTSDFPHNISLGTGGTVIVGIRSFEGRALDYSILVYPENETHGTPVTFRYVEVWDPSINPLIPGEGLVRNTTLGHGESFEEPFSFTFPSPGMYRVWFVLSAEDPSFTYRPTFLWVNATL
jgi:uncharacterized membrane protein